MGEEIGGMSDGLPGAGDIQTVFQVEGGLYKTDSDTMCTVILDSSNVAFFPVLQVGSSEEVVMYDGSEEDVKVEIDVCSVDVPEETFTQLIPQATRPQPHRRGSSKGPHICSYCNKTFTQVVNLVTHERIHTGEKPYKCSQCAKPFSQQPNLWKHMRIHTGERPYQCRICLKTFTQQANLTKHMRIHTGERPYVCQYCGKRFTQQANLTKHVRLHTGERPFHCSYCTKTFVQQSNLERHERTHTGVKPFQCKVCFETFGQKAHLTKHLRAIHKYEPDGVYSPQMKREVKQVVISDNLNASEFVILEQNKLKPLKQFGIPVLYCTKTGKIIKRVD